MATPGAIITLQLGNYANFVGSHFWNFQDETLGLLEHESLGSAAQEILAGKLFTHSQQLTPRLVVVDRVGCCGGVGLQDPVPNLPKEVLWQSGVQVLEAERVKPSKFYQLLLDENAEKSEDEDPVEVDGDAVMAHSASIQGAQEGPSAVEEAAAELDTPDGPAYFTDFFKSILHPRSVVEVPLLTSLQAPSGFGDIGAEDATRQQILEHVDERIRQFAEEASTLEGFQILCDPRTPWAGVAAACTAALADDYPGQTRICYSTRGPLQPHDRLMHELSASGSLSDALSTAHWMATNSLLIPLEVSSLSHAAARAVFDLTRPFHCAAAAAAAMDSCSLPWRIAPLAAPSGRAAADPSDGDAGPPSHGATTMAQWAAMLTQRGANIAATGAIMPAVSTEFVDSAEMDSRMSARERRLRGLPTERQQAVPAALVNEGLQWALGGAPNPVQQLLAESVVWRGCRHGGRRITASRGLEFLKGGLESEGVCGVRHTAAVAMPLPIPLPFPQVFLDGLSADGDLVLNGQQGQAQSRGGAGAAHAQASPSLDGALQRQHVRSCAVMSRTVASGVFEEVLKGHADVIKKALRSAPGKECLQRWDLQGEDVLEQRESLLRSAGLYQDVDWASSSDEDDAM